MGVKSTMRISRTAARARWVELMLEHAKLRQVLAMQAAMMSDKELEEDLELLNDSRAGGEGFENYLIVDPAPVSALMGE